MSGLTGLQAVVEDDDVDGAEGLGGLLGQALDERLVVEVSGNVQVVGLSAVESLPAAGEQQSRALAAEVGTHRLPDATAGAGHQGRDVVESHVRHSFAGEVGRGRGLGYGVPSPAPVS